MARFLFQLTRGPEDPTRAALVFLLAKAAVEAGHEVSVFLAGDAVQLLREPTLDAVTGVGTGSLREHYDGIVAGGGRFYLSRMSSNARGVDDGTIEGEPAEFVTPDRVVELVLEHDRVLTY